MPTTDGEFVADGQLRDKYGRREFAVRTLHEDLASGDTQAAGSVFDSDGREQVVLRNVATSVTTFDQPGVLLVAVGQGRLRFPVAITLLSVTATAGTAPTGASIKVDLNKNGTTVFTTQGNRPTIAIGANASADQVPDVTAIPADTDLTADIDQVGSTVPGSDLTVIVRYREA